MGLPGGRVDPGDASPLEAALRETREEIALDLEALGRPLGRLSEVRTHLPLGAVPHSVVPFAFAVEGDPQLKRNEEVQEALWVPLSFLSGPGQPERLHVGEERAAAPDALLHLRGARHLGPDAEDRRRADRGGRALRRRRSLPRRRARIGTEGGAAHPVHAPGGLSLRSRHDLEAAHGEIASLEAPLLSGRGRARGATGRGRTGRGSRRVARASKRPPDSYLSALASSRQNVTESAWDLPAQPLDEVGREAARGLEEGGSDRLFVGLLQLVEPGRLDAVVDDAEVESRGAPFRRPGPAPPPPGRSRPRGRGAAAAGPGRRRRQVGLPLGRGGQEAGPLRRGARRRGRWPRRRRRARRSPRG